MRPPGVLTSASVKTTSMTRLCSRCGGYFEPSKHFHRLCWNCWHEENDSSGFVRAPTNSLMQENRELRRTNRELAETLDEFREAANTAYEIRDQLPRLLQLCHPDKHQGSSASNEATAWLLNLRGRFPRRAA
jgi:hypothetical protein